MMTPSRTRPNRDPGEVPNAFIQRLSRLYCLLAGGATFCVLISFYLSSRPLNSHSFLLNLLVVLALGGGAFCGLKIAKQSSLDARKNEQLLQEARQRAAEISALYDTSQDVSVTHHLPVLLKNLVERARTLLNSSGCALFLVDTARGDFQIAAEVGVGMPVGTHIPLDEGLGGRVAKTLEPLIVNNFDNWPHRSQKLLKLPISAAMCVPMIRSGELIGVLGVHEVKDGSRKYTTDDSRLLSLFADNAAGAVQNARLLDALQSSEERFRIAAECASDIVYDWDLLRNSVAYFGTVLDKPRASKPALAKTRAEYWGLIHPEDCERIKESYREHLENSKPFSEEYRIQDARGAYISVADRATAIRNSQGIPIKLIGTLSNITERKQAEQMKSDFVSFVSHQLRTPLSGVKWMLELAMDNTDIPEETKSFLQDARASTERLIKLVNDLLDLSRLERGRLQITYQDVDLADLTRRVISEISPLMTDKGQTLLMETPADLPHLSADPQLLRQVILNLISNAMKYTSAGGEIKIQVTTENHRLLWQIRDTGIGIPGTDLGRLFEKFYRAGNALAVETEGTGLGLYLVRLIVGQFGGEVWCESEEGIGSTFFFALPIAAQEAR
jgi:signal transduction histidine kinase